MIPVSSVPTTKSSSPSPPITSPKALANNFAVANPSVFGTPEDEGVVGVREIEQVPTTGDGDSIIMAVTTVSTTTRTRIPTHLATHAGKPTLPFFFKQPTINVVLGRCLPTCYTLQRVQRGYLRCNVGYHLGSEVEGGMEGVEHTKRKSANVPLKKKEESVDFPNQNPDWTK